MINSFPLNAQTDHWETAVYANDEWNYWPGTSEPPAAWSLLSFNDDSWASGEGGIGYGDEDDQTVIDPVASLFIRHRFTVTDLSKIEEAILHADYDDGFVAYLNGTEIARANLEGSPPAFDTDATDYREALMYQGGLPEGFPLASVNLPDLLLEGDNVLAVQIHNRGGVFSSDLTSLFWLSFGINDDSSDYGPTPSWFPSNEFTSNLPILLIDTDGAFIPDEPAIPATMGIIWNADGSPNSSEATANEFMGNIIIERRGQSSLDLFPKNGYRIETKDEAGEDLDVSFLNFPAEEDWILHGPYSDKTLMRNVLAMEVARNMGQYASRTRFVELLINNSYEGIYVLMEKIKRDDNRVDIANLRPEDISGDQLTGGYVFKTDKGAPDWLSQYNTFNNPDLKLSFQYVSPNRNQIMPEQANYIQSYVDSFETAIHLPNGTFGGKRYDEYIDLASFADNFILTELSKDVDAYRISTYYHKDKDSNGGLLKAGPVWDFNIAFGNVDYCTGEEAAGWMYDFHCGISNPFWWESMFADPEFTRILKCRWEMFREGPLAISTLFNFIDEQAELLAPAAVRNFQRWPVLNEYVWPNPVVTGTYQGEIDYLKNFLAARIFWMDDNIFGECLPTATIEMTDPQPVRLYPNPTSGHLQIDLPLPASGDLSLVFYDQLGRRVHTQNTGQQALGRCQLDLRLPAQRFRNGQYFVAIQLDTQTLKVLPFVLNQP